MAREHANVRLDMWGDRDWRSLSPTAQWLYMVLLTHPKTNRAGVSDWRAGRIAQLAHGLSADDVRKIAAELAERFFIVIDEDTEEVLVRSFVKYDGVLKQPNMTITMVNDWTGVASARLQGVVAFEVQKIRARYPEWTIWEKSQLATLLETPGIDVRANPSADPSADPSDNPSSRGPSTTTSTSTTTNASHSVARKVDRGREAPLPKDWAPTADHIAVAKELGVDVIREADNFRLHAETHDRRAVRWNAAFTMWLKKAKPSAAAQPDRKVKKFVAHAD
jgi:hypothetical protein